MTVGDTMIVRDAMRDDAAGLAAIYAHHVLHGTGTFDTVPPTAADWEEKVDAIKSVDAPLLVAEIDGAVAGYAYAVQFRDRAAYVETCENSIYVAPRHVGSGVGTVLLPALLDASAAAGFREMIAVIGGGEAASVALHTKFGFAHAGRLRNVGRKFGRLLDTIYMQRSLRAPA